MRAVVGRVHDEGVVGDAEFVQEVQQDADRLVVVDHDVMVLGLPAAGLAQALRLGVGAEVHVRGVEPHEEGHAGVIVTLDEVDGLLEHFVVDRLHTLLGQRTGVDDGLAALAVRLAVQDAAGTEVRLEVREVDRVGIVAQFGLFLGVQVIEITEELVEAVHGRQVGITVAQMVLAELAGGIALALEDPSDGGILGTHAELGAGETHLGQARPEAALAGDEGGATGGAALLRVIVREEHSLFGDPVDVRGTIPHHPLGEDRKVGLTVVVPPHDQNIWLTLGHGVPLRSQKAEGSLRHEPIFGPTR